ncbi:transposase [[Eubacterium] cellulosolvens]|jgi:large subunit ribosomal protein L37Ae
MRKTRLGGGLATRYGTAPRRRHIDILVRLRKKHECPKCRVRAARRLSVGLWQCRRCGNQFTGGAYSPFTKVGEVAKRAAASATPMITTSELMEEETTLVSEAESEKPKRKRSRKKTGDSEKEEAK